MKNIFTSIIKKGNYDLTDILRKIDEYHIEGKITDEEKNQLYEEARHEPKAQYDVNAEIAALWKAIRERKGTVNTTPGQNDTLEWVQPTGAHNAYTKGDKVIYKGVVYESLISGNVWSPDVYPAGWTLADADAEEENDAASV